MIPIFIPSYKNREKTLLSIAKKVFPRRPILLFIYKCEEEQYKQYGLPYHCIESKPFGIQKKRKYIQDYATKNRIDRYWLIDDDVSPTCDVVKPNNTNSKGINIKTETPLIECMRTLERKLSNKKDFGIAGFSRDIGIVRYKFDKPILEHGFPNQIVLVNNKTLIENDIHYSDKKLNEDIQIVIDSLKNGLKVYVEPTIATHCTILMGGKYSTVDDFNELAVNNFLENYGYVTLSLRKDKLKTRINYKRIYKGLQDKYDVELYDCCKKSVQEVISYLEEKKKLRLQKMHKS